MSAPYPHRSGLSGSTGHCAIIAVFIPCSIPCSPVFAPLEGRRLASVGRMTTPRQQDLVDRHWLASDTISRAGAARRLVVGRYHARLVVDADAVHDELVADRRLGAGPRVPLRALDRRASARRRPVRDQPPSGADRRRAVDHGALQGAVRQRRPRPLPRRARQRGLPPRPRAALARRHRHRRADARRPPPVADEAADRPPHGRRRRRPPRPTRSTSPPPVAT